MGGTKPSDFLKVSYVVSEELQSRLKLSDFRHNPRSLCVRVSVTNGLKLNISHLDGT